MTEESLFERALNTPDAERAGLLDRECAGNPQLRARVAALLAAHAEPASFLDQPTGGFATGVMSTTDAKSAGRSFFIVSIVELFERIYFHVLIGISLYILKRVDCCRSLRLCLHLGS